MKQPMAREQSESLLALRTAFFVTGCGLACWAPLIPLLKIRLGVGEGALGLLLLCVGLGSALSMQCAGTLLAKLGARPLVICGGVGQALMLPVLAVTPSALTTAVGLLLFGACLGLIDVSVNFLAVEMEKRAAKPLMSGLHGVASVGGFFGALSLTGLLSANVSSLSGAFIASALMITAILFAAPRLIDASKVQGGSMLAVPRGVVIILATLAAIAFLTEGAVLNWGALLLTDKGLLKPAHAGIGYTVFAIAMTVGRLTGDAVVTRLGDRRTMIFGAVFAIAGFVVLLTASVASVALIGFLLIGLGASNTVPVLFRQAGLQAVMPPGVAIAAVTTVGYAGILVGPAMIGLAAQALGLLAAFWLLVLPLFLLPLLARRATQLGRPAAVA
jgi:predicted MFS family arabinose efflux permease